ncbi:hypothetical protein [Sphingomonas sp. LY160]|uniref:hypothetical protein n=1 Tax=Sphingomonas sp. LY160 TaxID=3095342 RepID=UPI002ADEA90D|nr:hypothetical protein [Sphingomonas sp. LY160]MEA1072431.1 hypothetical protein [Sphingomonas sp. LY160]
MTADAADLSGCWTGSYAYPGQMEPVPFTVELRDDGGRLSGLCQEDGIGFGRTGTMTATLSGTRSGTGVSFTKIYDAHDELIEPVTYDGLVQDDGHEIGGEWHIVGQWSGPFVMTRPRTATADEEVEIGETVEPPLA